jgi:hypothetical protein
MGRAMACQYMQRIFKCNAPGCLLSCTTASDHTGLWGHMPKSVHSCQADGPAIVFILILRFKELQASKRGSHL